MAGRLAGKVALISGGARGQGETEARLFVKEGAKVVFGDILVDLGQKVAADIVKQGGQATFVTLDVTQEADWQRAVDTTVRTYGKLDISREQCRDLPDRRGGSDAAWNCGIR